MQLTRGTPILKTLRLYQAKPSLVPFSPDIVECLDRSAGVYGVKTRRLMQYTRNSKTDPPLYDSEAALYL